MARVKLACMDAPQHLLLIGCTGMLTHAAATLSKRANSTTIVARDVERARLATPAADPLRGDWEDPKQLAHALRERCRLDGKFDLALLWVHASGERLWSLLEPLMTDDARVFEVLGSASRNPAELDDHSQLFEHHRRIVLGHEIESGKQRWLTHDEISEGALEAIRCDRSIVVGQLSS